jgi:hypothetical protein
MTQKVPQKYSDIVLIKPPTISQKPVRTYEPN